MAGSSGRRRAVGSRPSAAGATETRSFHLLLSWLGRFFSFFSCLSFVLFSHLASVSFLSRWESAGCFSLLLIFHQKMQARAVTSGTLPAMKEAWEETSATPGTRTAWSTEMGGKREMGCQEYDYLFHPPQHMAPCIPDHSICCDPGLWCPPLRTRQTRPALFREAIHLSGVGDLA